MTRCTNKTVGSIICVLMWYCYIGRILLETWLLPLRGQMKTRFRFSLWITAFKKHVIIGLCWVMCFICLFVSGWTYWLKWSMQVHKPEQNCTVSGERMCAIQCYRNKRLPLERWYTTGWKTHKFQELTAKCNLQFRRNTDKAVRWTYLSLKHEQGLKPDQQSKPGDCLLNMYICRKCDLFQKWILKWSWANTSFYLCSWTVHVTFIWQK